jgi:hypothetical protein
LNVKNIHEKNSRRINKLKEKYNSNVIIIWENDYRNDKNKITTFVINEIYKNKN